MRIRVRMRAMEKKVNTTQFDLHGDSPPMKNFYLNTKLVCSLPFGTEESILFLSDEPFADGDVFIAFPPVPFYKELKTTVRYEHRVETRGKDRRAANTPELPVTLSGQRRCGTSSSLPEQSPSRKAVVAPAEWIAPGKSDRHGTPDIRKRLSSQRRRCVAAGDARTRGNFKIRRPAMPISKPDCRTIL